MIKKTNLDDLDMLKIQILWKRWREAIREVIKIFRLGGKKNRGDREKTNN